MPRSHGRYHETKAPSMSYEYVAEVSLADDERKNVRQALEKNSYVVGDSGDGALSIVFPGSESSWDQDAAFYFGESLTLAIHGSNRADRNALIAVLDGVLRAAGHRAVFEDA
jgi:hypothetical protein